MVEDEPLLRASLVGVLTSLGSVDVIDAVNLTDARKPSAHIDRDFSWRTSICGTDPGVELAAGLDRAGRRIPIIFASATLGDYRDRLPQRPGVTFLEKPIAFERLRPLVEGHLADGTGLASLASSPFGVADYIQLAGMGRRSVVIDVRSRSAAAAGGTSSAAAKSGLRTTSSGWVSTRSGVWPFKAMCKCLVLRSSPGRSGSAQSRVAARVCSSRQRGSWTRHRGLPRPI